MRQYRGKTKDGEWVFGWLADVSALDANCPGIRIIQQLNNGLVYHPVQPATVGQSTGRKDTKRTKEYPEGQEIFEGDIMEYYNACVRKGEDPNCQQVVRWNKRQACFEGCFNGGEVIATIHDEDKP